MTSCIIPTLNVLYAARTRESAWELGRQSQVVWEIRAALVGLKTALGDKGEDELRIDNERNWRVRCCTSRVALGSFKVHYSHSRVVDGRSGLVMICNQTEGFGVNS